MRARTWAIVVVAVAVVAGVTYAVTRPSSGTSRNLIVTATVARRTLEDDVTLTGTLSRLVQRTVSAPAAGQISSVSVSDGSVVHAGSPLIGIDGRDSVAEPGSFPFFRALSMGDTGLDVRQLDQILTSSGYNPGPIGNRYTAQTQSALAQWQAAEGYPGASTETPQTVTMSLQPSAGYQLGAESAAGVVIGSAAAAASTTAATGPTTTTTAAATTPTTAATPPTLTIQSLDEVTAKGSPATFIVYASSTSDTPVEFNVVEGGDAPANEVLPPTGPFVIAAGVSSVEVQVPTRINDLVQEEATVTLELASGAGYQVGDPSVAATTVKSADLPTLTLTAETASVTPGGSTAFTITADQAPVQNTSVSYQLFGTAVAGQDYEPLPGTALLLAGHSSVVVVLNTIDKNIVFEPTDMITGNWPIRVGQVMVKAGDIVAPDDPLFTLTDTNFTVTLVASPSDRTQLAVGQSVTVTLQGGTAQASGVISQLDDNVTVNVTTQAETYMGKISVGNLGAADGAAVTIDVDLQDQNNVLTVPIAAVKQNGLGQDVVRVIDLANRGHVTEVPVRTGLADSSYIQIDSGLTEGEVVIVEETQTTG